jgi:hypothetical protein
MCSNSSLRPTHSPRNFSWLSACDLIEMLSCCFWDLIEQACDTQSQSNTSQAHDPTKHHKQANFQRKFTTRQTTAFPISQGPCRPAGSPQIAPTNQPRPARPPAASTRRTAPRLTFEEFRPNDFQLTAAWPLRQTLRQFFEARSPPTSARCASRHSSSFRPATSNRLEQSGAACKSRAA